MTTTVFGDGINRVAVREIIPNIYWITHCLGDQAKNHYADYFATVPNPEAYVGDRIVDYPFSAFLIVDEKSLLIDTVAPVQRDNMLKALAAILGDRGLDYIWISHIELPHAGNAAPIKRQYPEAQLVTIDGGDHYELHGLGDALLVSPGDVIDLGQRSVEMVDALFVDHGLSQWLYERETGFLFTADWGHNLHEPAKHECFMFMDEMEAGGYSNALMTDDVKVNAWFQFPWLAFTDAEEICAAIDALFEQYDVKIFAPSHGNVIRKDVPNYIEMLKTAMRQAIAMPYPGTLK
ncbi:MAG: MBL fold metallo-hydrolase [Chloroflexota bacterium]